MKIVQYALIAAIFLFTIHSAFAVPSVNSSRILPATAYYNDTLIGFASANTTNQSLVYEYLFFVNGTANASGNTARYFYQESANIATSEGGLSSGSCANATNYLYCNYTKPSAAMIGSLWMVKHGPVTDVAYNITLPSACWNASATMISLRIYSERRNDGGSSVDASAPQCSNGTTWIDIGTNKTGTQGGFPGGAQDASRLVDADFNTPNYFSSAVGYWSFVDPATWSQNAFIWEEGMFWLNGSASATEINVGNLTSGWNHYTNITLQIMATDDDGNSSYFNSTQLTISNYPPVASGGLVSAITGGVNCTYTYSDDDSDAESGSTYRWFKNGSSLSLTSRTISSGNYTVNDVLICEVRPKDANDFGSYLNSSNFTVGDSVAPTISGIIIPSDGNDTNAVNIYANCSDNYALSQGHPKVSWENQLGVRTSNFSMTLVSGDQFVKSFLFSAGAYQDFIFVCADGTGNTSTTQSNDILSIAAGAGGGSSSGGGGDVTDFSTDVTSCGVKVIQPSDTIKGLVSVLCPIDGTKSETIIMSNPGSSTTTYRVTFTNMTCDKVPDFKLEGKTGKQIDLTGCTCPTSEMSANKQIVEGQIKIIDLDRGQCFAAVKYTSRGSWLAAHPFLSVAMILGSAIGLSLVFAKLTN